MNWGKLLSGRFIFTVVSAYVFAFMATSGQLGKEDVIQLVMMIAIFYFHKEENKK